MILSKSALQEAIAERLAHHQIPGAGIVVFHDGRTFTTAVGVVNVVVNNIADRRGLVAGELGEVCAVRVHLHPATDGRAVNG